MKIITIKEKKGMTFLNESFMDNILPPSKDVN